MTRTLFHCKTDQIELPKLLECAGEPIRLAILVRLAEGERDQEDLRCRDFGFLGGKSKLTYHFDKLRDAGLVTVSIVGTSRYVRLRRDDLQERFPGLLDVLISSAQRISPGAGVDPAASLA